MSKIIKLTDSKLKKLLEEKAVLITSGRAKSEEIEVVEKEMEEVDTQIKDIEKQVNIDDFLAEEKVLVAKVEEAIKEMGVIKQNILERLKGHGEPELFKKYDDLKVKKDELETERNKIALKAMKFNGKIIPLGRKLMKPYLEDEYSDYDTIRIENEEIVATIFSHMEDFITNFKKKNI